MEGAAASTPLQHSGAGWRELGRDLGLLAVLLALAGGVRAWVIGHTEVAARDSIGFIRYALQLEQQPVRKVLRASQQHPGYPAALLAVSLPVRHYLGATDSDTMRLSAQLTSALAGVLLVVPMFYLGRALFSRRVGFWASALFQCLPESGRIMSDALSEATFLLWMTTALLLAVHALRNRSRTLFGLCGVCGGLAYLTRPEGALVVAAAGLVLLAMQAHPGWRWPWRHLLACGTSLTVAALAVGAPYAGVTRHLTVKPSVQELLKSPFAFSPEDDGPSSLLPTGDERPVALAMAGGRPFALPVLAVRSSDHDTDAWWGLEKVTAETVKAFHYVAWLPALLGLWWFRDRLWAVPGALVLLLLCLLQGLILWRLAVVVGYVSSRHVLLFVLCGAFWAVAAVEDVPRRLAALFPRFSASRRGLSAALLAGLVLAGLPKTLKPLHANRAGHHQAGLWLSGHVTPADHVFDPFCWAHYYSGQFFHEGARPTPAPGQVPVCYVVLEPRDRERDRAQQVSRAQQLAAQGQLVYHWPADRPADRAEVLVYAVPGAGL
jgi:hypothetical protein